MPLDEDCESADGFMPCEWFMETFAFMSLVSPDQAEREDYAKRAKTLLMSMIETAALGPADGAGEIRASKFSVGDRSRGGGRAFGLTVDWIYPYLSGDDKKEESSRCSSAGPTRTSTPRSRATTTPSRSTYSTILPSGSSPDPSAMAMRPRLPAVAGEVVVAGEADGVLVLQEGRIVEYVDRLGVVVARDLGVDVLVGPAEEHLEDLLLVVSGEVRIDPVDGEAERPAAAPRAIPDRELARRGSPRRRRRGPARPSRSRSSARSSRAWRSLRARPDRGSRAT
ncbi:MAG: hypothetical protein V9F03_05215 [Microthrixaceae bacterium]